MELSCFRLFILPSTVSLRKSCTKYKPEKYAFSARVDAIESPLARVYRVFGPHLESPHHRLPRRCVLCNHLPHDTPFASNPLGGVNAGTCHLRLLRSVPAFSRPSSSISSNSSTGHGFAHVNSDLASPPSSSFCTF